VHLLQLEDLSQLYGKKKYAKLFDLMTISNQATHVLKSEVHKLLADKATVVCEGADLMLNLSKDDRAAFNARLLDLSRQFIGCVHMPEKREEFKLFNDRQLPLYFLSFHRAAAAAIMAQEAEVRARAAREKEAGEGGEVRTDVAPATAAEAAAEAADCLQETLVASGSSSADDGPSDEELRRLSLLDVTSAAAEAEAVPFISRRPAGAAASPAVAAAPTAAEKENEKENGGKHTKKVMRGSLSDFGVCSITGLPAKYRYSIINLLALLVQEHKS